MPTDDLHAFVFKNRGAVLALPALALAAFGKPSALSVTLGLPMAIAGELVRCWAVGYSGVSTRGDTVSAPELVTAGPYAYVRNPLYAGNFLTACGFAIAFTGKNALPARLALIAGSLGVMAAVYATIVPHEERFLRSQFGEAFERYCERVPPVIPQLEPMPGGAGAWRPAVIREAESKTFLTFGAMLAALALKALKA
jgi:protein-S-isoprenylcysteine O-methyltransferase Ste14